MAESKSKGGQGRSGRRSSRLATQEESPRLAEALWSDTESPVAMLVESFEAAWERSRRTGRAAKFVVAVEADGRSTIMPLEGPTAASDLDRNGIGDELERAIAAARLRGQSPRCGHFER